MLIFHGFPDETKARTFMAAITQEFNLRTYYCRVEGSGYIYEENRKPDENEFIRGALDVFPYRLKPPIVLTERSLEKPGVGSAVEARARDFGGWFAGT